RKRRLGPLELGHHAFEREERRVGVPPRVRVAGPAGGDPLGEAVGGVEAEGRGLVDRDAGRVLLHGRQRLAVDRTRGEPPVALVRIVVPRHGPTLPRGPPCRQGPPARRAPPPAPRWDRTARRRLPRSAARTRDSDAPTSATRTGRPRWRPAGGGCGGGWKSGG